MKNTLDKNKFEMILDSVYHNKHRAVFQSQNKKIDEMYRYMLECKQDRGFTHLENQTQINADMLSERNDSMSKMIDRRITVGGKVIRIRATSEQDYAEKVVEAMTGTQAESIPATSQKHDFREYGLEWFDTFSAPNISKATATTYQRQLKLYWIPAFAGKCIEEISPADIQQVFNSMEGVAKETKQKAKVVLNMVFEQALEDDLIKKNPLASKSIRLTGRSAKETEPYSVDEMRYIVAHLNDIKDATDRAYMALQALHPLRLEEVLGLTFEDVDCENGIIHVRRSVTHPNRNQPEVKETKTEASCRDIDFVKQASNCIPRSGKPDSFIIGGDKPYSYTQVRRMCDRIRRDIGFEGKITPRRFRSTVLTDLYDATKDIKQAQAAAGHTTAAMTLKHYIKGRTTTSNTAIPVASLYGLS